MLQLLSYRCIQSALFMPTLIPKDWVLIKVVLIARLSLCERYGFGALKGCVYSDAVLIRSVPVIRVDCMLCRMESSTARISQHSQPAAMQRLIRGTLWQL